MFGATERMRFPGPDGGVAHAEIEIGDSVVIVEDESPYRGTQGAAGRRAAGLAVFLFLYVGRRRRDRSPRRWSSARRSSSAPRRRSSTATGTPTSSTRSGTAGRSRRTSRTCRRTRLMRPDGRAVGIAGPTDEVRAAVRRDREFATRAGGDGPDERERAYQRVHAVVRRPTPDKIRGGSKLQAAETATTVRLGPAASRSSPTGRSSRARRSSAGYTEIEVADLDEALRMVKTWPGCPIVEIRPVQQTVNPDDELARVVRDHAGRLAADRWCALTRRLRRRRGPGPGRGARAALQRWPVEGIPERPDAWLFTVARRRGLDVAAPGSRTTVPSWPSSSGPCSRRRDDRLRLIFTCCHPALARDRRRSRSRCGSSAD